jgi:uncharacterized protein YggU (UPF0235/DUF167 family)
MASLTVRVVPRSGRTGVETGERGVAVRVRASAEGGRATEEARKALAHALGTTPSEISLRKGRPSREKVFDLAGMTEEEALQRLRSGEPADGDG